MKKVAVGVLISGRGSNMEALIDAARDPAYPARIALVLSNKADAGGLKIAREAGIPTAVIDHRPFGKDREAHERLVHQALTDAGVRIVALAGYMRVLTPWLVDAWAGRMINIHPSLLPAYPGLDTHGRALGDGVAEHGCTVHLVTAGVDEGPVLGQARVPVLPGDDEATLAARVLAAEHVLYPACLGQFATNLA
jgi:formyltetrahydrofolate-dependent phosphoribosylglycinamide formyltransferase